MRNRSLVLRASVTLAVLAFTGVVHARAEYVTALPNGSGASCVWCHPGGTVTALTDFGTASNNLVGTDRATWWDTLWDVDSDLDGQTNGQELGDPCGDWDVGEAAPRTTDISNPGVLGETSADPNSPDCGAGGGGPGGTTGATSGASSGAGAGSGDSTGAGMARPPTPVATGACAIDGAAGSDGDGTLWSWAAAGAVAGLLGMSRARRRRR